MKEVATENVLGRKRFLQYFFFQRAVTFTESEARLCNQCQVTFNYIELYTMQIV